MTRRLLLYFVCLSIPLLLGAMAWQSARYADQERELERLETVQEDWVESNKRLIAVIAVLSSPERIEHVARTDLGLSKIAPEAVLQIRIEGRGRNDG